ncbi:hypothetical protein [Facklamia sp. P13069]|uniref:hypothetical protein n=1 Tax=Facklamia sp. P13069 TaxID=3421954 RepID=UPI003D1665C0
MKVIKIIQDENNSFKMSQKSGIKFVAKVQLYIDCADIFQLEMEVEWQEKFKNALKSSVFKENKWTETP